MNRLTKDALLVKQTPEQLRELLPQAFRFDPAPYENYLGTAKWKTRFREAEFPPVEDVPKTLYRGGISSGLAWTDNLELARQYAKLSTLTKIKQPGRHGVWECHPRSEDIFIQLDNDTWLLDKPKTKKIEEPAEFTAKELGLLEDAARLSLNPELQMALFAIIGVPTRLTAH